MSFPPVFQIEEITFKNYYTAYVTVRLLRRSPGQEAPAKWCTALRDLPLMDNPHTEGGSQDYYSIHRTQMQAEADHVVSVRLILRQPSSAWLTFSLEDVKIFPHLEPDPEKEVSDWLSDLTLVDQHPDLEGLPDPQTVSSSIQQMWALTEVMQTNQTTASIGRFDVDGCYDINLLSLT
ncbi:nicolin-1-like [Stegastes partitus]|uniref:Nicolin-1-like n=1 Tax=Stegastes partitus TaxID=144197 RepID=A0A9Y4NVG1_9TELE|nr:PREDICTED: nicolin-1-like [Stegastes partitus]